MALITNRGIYRILDRFFRNAAPPTNFYLALVTDAVEPTVDTNTLGELTQIAAGSGYSSGGEQLDLNGTDFENLTEDDGNSRALVEIRDVILTATGGNIPASGDGARYAVLTDDNATVANREVYVVFDLGVDRAILSGAGLGIVDAIIRLQQPSTVGGSYLTNRGLYLMLSHFLLNTPDPANFYLALLNSPAAITSNTLTDLSEVDGGNGYTAGGVSIARNSTDFPTLTEDDAANTAYVVLKDVDFEADGGSIGPVTGAALLTDEATAGDRQVIAVWTFGSTETVTDTNILRLSGATISGRHPLSATGGNGSGGVTTGAWLVNENWGPGGLPITYRDSPVEPLSWSRALSIDGVDTVNSQPLRNGQVYNGAYCGVDKEYNSGLGRWVLRCWAKGLPGQSIGARCPIVVDNWKYTFLQAYAGQTIYGRFYVYVPSINMGSGGSWCTLGTQLKTTQLYGSAGIQQNIEEDGGSPSGWQWWWRGFNPDTATDLAGSNNIVRPDIITGQWHKIDFEWLMDNPSGEFDAWTDEVHNFTAGPDVLARTDDYGNFYILLYGDKWTGAEQNVYFGDVMLADAPITDS